MASISTGGGHGGKKSVDHEIPLIPFIDLLLCCVMFLLVTAVWNQLARLELSQQTPGPSNSDPVEQEERNDLILLISKDNGYTIAATASGERTPIPKNGDNFDVVDLRRKLEERRRLEPNRRDLKVAPEDRVQYRDVIQAMDIATGVGFNSLSIADPAAAI